MLAHSIEEYDQIRLLSGLGYNVFSIGGYIDPARPHDPKRPGLPEVQAFPDLKTVVDGLDTSDNLTRAKEHIPDALLAWADVIICHHYEYRWLWPQWDRIRDKRVVWRTVGQSTSANEAAASRYRTDGLQIVRYSPRERHIPDYAGEDALIRFYKDPQEWTGWIGSESSVINITQHLMQRGNATNGEYWRRATLGLPAKALGPGSTVLGGPGELTLLEMQTWLRQARAYLYTGTQPASYTLGLIEAMMTGIPTISIGPAWMQMLSYGPLLFEGAEITRRGYDDPMQARAMLQELLVNPAAAKDVSSEQQSIARETFGMDVVGAAWKDFLG